MTTPIRHAATSLACLLVAAGASAEKPTRPSPFSVAEGLQNSAATRLAVNAVALEALQAPGQFTMTGFPIDSTRSVDLILERFEVLAPDARIVLGSPEGDTPLPRPDVTLLRGHVAGEPGSFVYLALSPHGNNGYVATGGSTHILSQRKLAARPAPGQLRVIGNALCGQGDIDDIA